jgi:hypothetical protein
MDAVCNLGEAVHGAEEGKGERASDNDDTLADV